MLTVVTLDPIYVDFTVNETELAQVRRFMTRGPVSVEASLPADTVQATGADNPTTRATAAPGSDRPEMSNSAPTTAPAGMDQPMSGKLTFLDNSVQDGSGTVKLRATLPNPEKHFWPGQFVNVKLILEVQKGAILIPRRATQISQTGPFVYAIDDKSMVHVTPVVLGQIVGEQVVVESGLTPGQKVVVTGQMLLQDGMPVTVVPSGPPGGGPRGNNQSKTRVPTKSGPVR